VISAATIRPGLAARTSSVFWQAPAVRSFKDIAVTCPCHWAMTFAGRRVSGWVLSRPLPGCVHHGKQAAR
jgi:hypothetical protein